MCKGGICSRSAVFPVVNHASCSPHMNQHMATERKPFPKGELQWREKHSAEIPNKIMITTEHFTSCLHTKMKINTSKTEMLNLIIFFKKDIINPILSKLWEKNEYSKNS